MKNIKKIIILLIIIFPSLIIIGTSSWIIIEKNDFSPEFNWLETLASTSFEEVTFNVDENGIIGQSPNSQNDLIMKGISYKWQEYDISGNQIGDIYDDILPKDVGIYYFEIKVDGTDYLKQCVLTIKEKEIEVKIVEENAQMIANLALNEETTNLFIYNGKNQKPILEPYNLGIYSDDYNNSNYSVNVGGSDCIDVGTYYISNEQNDVNYRPFVINRNDGKTKINYKVDDNIIIKYEIVEKNIDDAIMEIDSDIIYNGKEQKIEPKFKIKLNGDSFYTYLVKNEDYIIEGYENNINASSNSKIIIKGIGNYTGTKTFEFEIKPFNIDSEFTKLENFEDSYIYCNDFITPVPTVYTLIEKLNNNDYEISYLENLNVGMGQIIIKGIGNFTGQKVFYFNILPKTLTKENVLINEEAFIYNKTQIKPSISVNSPFNNDLIINQDYEVSYGENINAGEGTVVVKGINNYDGEIIVKFTIHKAKIDKSLITINYPENKNYYTTSYKINELSFNTPINGNIVSTNNEQNNLTVGLLTYNLKFIPEDINNYDIVEFDILINVYATITFVNDDDKVIDIQEIEKGSSATSPANPAKESTNEYNYTFIGWDQDFTNVSSDLTIKALYEESIRYYTVRFIDWNNEVLKTEYVKYKESGTPPTPVRSSTDKYIYTFVKWSKDYTCITEDTDIIAIYKEEIRKYKVVFYDGDNNEFDVQYIEYSSSALSPEASPTKEGYTFIKWDKDYTNITSDLDIYPVFSKTKLDPKLNILNLQDGKVETLYNGSPQEIKVTKASDGDITILYDEKDELPIHAGTYIVTIDLDETDIYEGLSLTIEFIIQKIDPILITNPTLSKDTIYEGEDLQLIGGNVYGINNEELIGNFKFTKDISNLVYSGTSSEYIASLEATFVYSNNTDYNDVVLNLEIKMLPVAYIKISSSNKKYYGTLEKAIISSTSGQSIYIIPGQIIMIKNTITLNNKISLYIPYEDETYDTSTISESNAVDINQTNVDNYRKTQLIFTENANLVIENGSKLYLGGTCGTKGIYGLYSEITLGESSHIDIYGEFYSYGYVKELNPINANSVSGEYYKNELDINRYINVYSTGYLITSLALYDMKTGGPLSTYISNDICPLDVFDFPNLQTYVKIESGGKVDGIIRASVAGVDVKETANIIRGNVSEDALFYVNSGNIAIEHCTPNNSKYSSTNSITRIYIDGDVKLGYLKFKVSGTSIDTSKYFLPISYKLKIYILESSNVLFEYKVKFMPGSSIQINESAEININNEIVIHSGKKYANVSSTTYSYTATDAIFINNGTIIFSENGKLGGDVLTTNNDKTAVIKLSGCDESVLKATSYEGLNNTEISYELYGYFYNEETNEKEYSQFVIGSDIYAYGKNTNSWQGEANKSYELTVKVKSSSNTTCGYRVYQADDENGTNQTELTTNIYTSSFTFTIPSGKYIKIVDEQSAISVEFTSLPDGVNYVHSNDSWYLMSGDIELTLTAASSYNIYITTESTSGAGKITYSLYTSSTKDGTYTLITTSTTELSASVVQNQWFYVVVGGGYTADSATVKSGPEGLETFKFGENNKYQMTTNYTMHVSSFKSSCLVEGTIITMFDLTKKKVEEINPGDLLLVFNHETGMFDVSEVLFNDKEVLNTYEIINLKFSNGSLIRVVDEHGFFDLDLMQYVYITSTNYHNYIGHHFVSITNNNGQIEKENVTLDFVNITYEKVRVYSPVTKYHLNYVTEDLLSMPGGIEGLFNIFEYDNSLKYDENKMNKDIVKYGLFTYDDFKDLVSEEIYDSFSTKYFKVAIGKGILSYDKLYYYIYRYTPLI